MSLVSSQVFGEHGYLKLRSRQKELAQIEQEVRKLEQEKQQLEKRIQKLRSDPETIEQIAREEMKLVRPDEVIYTVPAPPAAPSTAPTQPTQPKK